MYGKYIRQRTVCYVHDENNESGLGDTVEIVESRPVENETLGIGARRGEEHGGRRGGTCGRQAKQEAAKEG
jgi:hypothetical protein